MAKKPFKVISLFDIHYWEHIDLKPVLQFIKDEQPNEIILGWDQLDFKPKHIHLQSASIC